MRRVGLILGAVLVAASLVAAWGSPTNAQQQACAAVDSSTEEVADGVVLTWDSSFLCENAAPSGEYSVTVGVSNGGTRAATLESARLTHTTPRPRGDAPEATAQASGLPLSLAPGEQGSFSISGSYELVETDEGAKANLHIAVSGSSEAGERFSIGLNVMLRGPGAVEDGGSDAEAGPPAGVPGPPEARPGRDRGRRGTGRGRPGRGLRRGGDRRQEAGGPPSWVPGPPPWVEEVVSAATSGRGGPPSWVPGPPPRAGRG